MFKKTNTIRSIYNSNESVAYRPAQNHFRMKRSRAGNIPSNDKVYNTASLPQSIPVAPENVGTNENSVNATAKEQKKRTCRDKSFEKHVFQSIDFKKRNRHAAHQTNEDPNPLDRRSYNIFTPPRSDFLNGECPTPNLDDETSQGLTLPEILSPCTPGSDVERQIEEIIRRKREAKKDTHGIQ